MEEPISELEKMQQQFDAAPYPNYPLAISPKEDSNTLFFHNFMTPYYLRNQKVINLEGKLILDVGCGTGYTSLILAEANPGADIIGVDLSEKSVELAAQRLGLHGHKNAQFYALSIYDLEKLNLQFDYINCDEVLYLIPDAIAGLQAMKSVLKPDGLIRTNLHSLANRFFIYQAQKLFDFMGLMNGPVEDFQVQLVRELMNSLKNGVLLKVSTWKNEDTSDLKIRSNHLLQGDKGFSIPDTFAALETAELEFLSMVEWRSWELTELFQDPENLPAFLAMSLPESNVEDKLHLFELLHPVNRLIDFWCGHPQAGAAFVPVSEWTESNWQQAQVHLHPQLRTETLKVDLIQSIRDQKPFVVSQTLNAGVQTPIVLESTLASCLLPLWDSPQPVRSLVEHWLQVKPIDPVTCEAVAPATAFEQIKQMLMNLEIFLFVLLERQ